MTKRFKRRRRGKEEIDLVTISHVTGVMLSYARRVSYGEAEEFSEIKG